MQTINNRVLDAVSHECQTQYHWLQMSSLIYLILWIWKLEQMVTGIGKEAYRNVKKLLTYVVPYEKID